MHKFKILLLTIFFFSGLNNLYANNTIAYLDMQKLMSQSIQRLELWGKFLNICKQLPVNLNFLWLPIFLSHPLHGCISISSLFELIEFVNIFLFPIEQLCSHFVLRSTSLSPVLSVGLLLVLIPVIFFLVDTMDVGTYVWQRHVTEILDSRF